MATPPAPMRTLGIATHPRFAERGVPRDTFANPFDAVRITLINSAVRSSGLPLTELSVEPATLEQVAAVHTPEYIDVIRAFSDGTRTRESASDFTLLGPTVPVEDSTFDLACLGCGAAIAAVDAVLDGSVSTALVVARPGDHHASPGHGEGFCVFNYTAVAARHAQRAHGVERILILDFDVHHGQGTQACFASDPSVYTWSIHSYGSLYPRTGPASDKGAGAGRGSVMNVPIEARSRDRAWFDAFRSSLKRIPGSFDLVLAVAGVDAHEDDPVGDLRLSSEAYGVIGQLVREFVETRAGGRLVSSAAGGYNPATVGELITRYIEGLVK